jgi:hypothetical protein
MTTHYGTTHRTLPEPKPVLAAWKTVSSLPVMGEGIEPRRRRVYTCPHLLIDGEPVSRILSIAPHLPGNHITGGYCQARRSDVSGPYVADVCGSSWSDPKNKDGGCPFLPEKDAAA